MRLMGRCQKCGRFRYVRVSNHALVMMAARGSHMAEGICHQCEEAPRGKRG